MSLVHYIAARKLSKIVLLPQFMFYFGIAECYIGPIFQVYLPEMWMKL